MRSSILLLAFLTGCSGWMDALRTETNPGEAAPERTDGYDANAFSGKIIRVVPPVDYGVDPGLFERQVVQESRRRVGTPVAIDALVWRTVEMAIDAARAKADSVKILPLVDRSTWVEALRGVDKFRSERPDPNLPAFRWPVEMAQPNAEGSDFLLIINDVTLLATVNGVNGFASDFIQGRNFPSVRMKLRWLLWDVQRDRPAAYGQTFEVENMGDGGVDADNLALVAEATGKQMVDEALAL